MKKNGKNIFAHMHLYIYLYITKVGIFTLVSILGRRVKIKKYYICSLSGLQLALYMIPRRQIKHRSTLLKSCYS